MLEQTLSAGTIGLIGATSEQFSSKRIPRTKQEWTKMDDNGQIPAQGSLKTYLSRQEIAERFGVSEKTVDRWLRKYGVKTFRAGKTVRVATDEIEKLERARSFGG